MTNQELKNKVIEDMKETGELNCLKDLDDFEALELLKKEELIEIILDMEERIECLKKKLKK